MTRNIFLCHTWVSYFRCRQLSIIVLAALVPLSPIFAAVSCTVNATPLTFGSYDTFGPAAIESTGTVSIDCSGQNGDTVSYAILLSSGGGTYVQRRIGDGNDHFCTITCTPTQAITATVSW